jgi:predicted RND superfamily exporter protein/rhodanese-related sulfurtransferase
MQKLLKLFRPLIILNFKHPVLVLLSCVLLAIVGGYFASNLKVDTDIANLLPDTNKHVVALNKLQDTVGGETEMRVAIKSPDFEANLAFAEMLIEESMKLFYDRRQIPFFNRFEFRRETDVLKDNALYLATDSEMQDIITFLEEEIEQAKMDANPFLFDLFDDEEFDDLESEGSSDINLDSFKESYNDLIPTEYPVNADSTLLVIKLFPAGSKSDIRYLEDMFQEFGDLVEELNPASFHPQMEVKFGGRLKRHLNELESIMEDVLNSFSTGIGSVILLVILYFFIKKYVNYRRSSRINQKHSIWAHLLRAPVPFLVIGIPLIISLMWTFGLAYLHLGVLNTMTSVLFVILFGLGIDYGIHYYARYIELRSDGEDIEEALLHAYQITGAAIMVSAVTTASALFILMFADFRGFSEFGFIAGVGILLALFCMLFVLPSLLVLFEKMNWILLYPRSKNYKQNEYIKRYPFSKTIVVIGLLISAVVLINSGNLRFEFEFGKLEPEFPEFVAFQEFASGVDEGGRRNPAYIIADTDEDVFEILEILRLRKASNPDTKVADIDALQERFPPNDDMAMQKLENIARVRALLQDPVLINQQDENLDILRRASQTTEPLDETLIPDFLKNRFMTQEGEIGKFVIIYPAVGLSDGRNSIAFKNEIGTVELSSGKVYHATSTSIVAAEMLELMHNESPYMVIATFILVFVFMLYSFWSVRWSLMALIPLVIGLLVLFGFMLIFGLKFNFYNLVVLPAILGIGCDNGVHLAHRYRHEGRNSMWNVLSSTGQHISIGSLTTMLGFAGLLFTAHPGLQSIGIMAVLGIGMTLLTAIIFLPAMIQVLEDKNWIRF